MRQFATLLAFCVVSLGCEFGPAQLDSFCFQRDRFQGFITEIETKHNLVSRDVIRREERLADEERWRRLQGEQAEHAKLYEAWFATLTPYQKFQWMLVQQQNGIQREWMQTEKEKVRLTPPPQINVHNSTSVVQAQAQ